MEYQNLTLKNAVNLAAPHTWAAAVFPVLLGTLLAVALEGSFSLPVFIMVLGAAVLLQSSVNTINDYYDFTKGNDLRENSDDPDDAVLVYNNLSPMHVLRLGLGYMAAAVLLGIYPVYRGGAVTLTIGVAACLVIVAYSAGRTPISYLPLGEIVSGGVMGGFLTVAVFSAFTGHAGWRIFLLSAPLVVGIGLIMMTNNTCDIERDTPIGRTTLPLIIGRARARVAYRIFAWVWIALIIALTAAQFTRGLLPVGIALAASVPAIRRLLGSTLTPDRRRQCMGAILKANLWLNCAYLAGILGHILWDTFAGY